MAKSEVQRTTEYRDRKKAKERDSRLFAEIIVDRLAVEDRITITVERTPDAIDFVWGPATGAQDAYDDLQAFCTEHGRDFREVMLAIEGCLLEAMLPKLGMKLAGPGRWIPSAEEKAKYLATLS